MADIDFQPDQPMHGPIDFQPESSVGGAAWRKFAHGVIPFDAQIVGAGNALQKKLQGSDKPIGDIYDQEVAARRQQLAADQEQHPTVSTIADVAGMAAGPAKLLPGGTAAKQLFKSGAAIGAARGFAESDADLPQRLADTAGSALTGGALTVVGGKVLEPVVNAASRLSAPMVDWLKGVGRRQAIRSIGGVPGETANEMADWLLKQKQIRPLDTSKAIDSRLGQTLSRENENVAGALERADSVVKPRMASDVNAGADVGDLGGRVSELASDARSLGPAYNGDASGLATEAREIMRRPEAVLPPSEAHLWAKSYADKGKKDIANAAGEWARDAVHQAGPEIGSAFDAASLNAGMAKTAKALSGPAASAQQAPLLTHGQTALGLAGTLAKRVVAQRASSTTAVVANTASQKIAQLAQTAPQALGRFAPVLANALAAGPTEYNAKVFTLSQTDPEFQALQSKIGGSNQ